MIYKGGSYYSSSYVGGDMYTSLDLIQQKAKIKMVMAAISFFTHKNLNGTSHVRKLQHAVWKNFNACPWLSGTLNNCLENREN